MSSELKFAAPNASEVIVTGPKSLFDWRERHRVKVPGHQFTPQFKWKKWDGTWAPGKYCRPDGDAWEMRCSRGTLRRLMTDFGVGVDFHVARDAEVEEFVSTRPEFAQLRDFQSRSFRKALAEGWSRVAFATNAGKGAVIGELAAFAKHRGDPVLILCDEIAVFDALLGEVTKWGGFKPRLVRSGVEHPPPAGSATIAMVQTLARRIKGDDADRWLEWLRSVRMLLLDEADKADAATWRSILTAAKNTDWRTGFSGTFPNDLHGQLVMDELMGPVIDSVKNADLIDRKISARPRIEVHGHDATAALGSLPPDWWFLDGPARRAATYARAIIYNDERHAFIGSLIKPDTPTVVIVDKIDHGLSLSASIEGSVFLDGSAADSERLQVLEDFAAGAVRVIVVTKILDRGTNRLGHAADVIFASAEGSQTQVLQRIGRGLRRTDGKEFLRLVDVIDRVRFQATDKRMANAASFLQAAAKRRLQVYADEGFDVQLIPH